MGDASYIPYEGIRVCIENTEDKDVYCSDYELFFRDADSEYTISAEYCLDLDSTSYSDCRDVVTVSSDSFTVECPDVVDCMPFIEQPLWLVCGYNRDLFQEQCPRTMILF